MLLEERIEAFSKLGNFLSQFSRRKIEKHNDVLFNDIFFDTFKLQLKRAKEYKMNISGFSFHVGSGCYNSNQYYEAVKTIYDIMINTKNLNTSNNIITTQEQKIVLDKYKELVYGDKENLNKDLAGMQVMSLEIQYLVDQVASKYCITDKADGDKYQLFIFNDNIYLISNNMVVRKTKYTIKNMPSSFQDKFPKLPNPQKIYCCNC